MNYLIQLWRRWHCKHNFKYAMRISSEGAQFRVYECSACFDVRYERIEDDDDEDGS